MSDVEKDGSVKPKPDEPKRWEHREEFMSLLPFLWPKEEPRLKVRAGAQAAKLLSALACALRRAQLPVRPAAAR